MAVVLRTRKQASTSTKRRKAKKIERPSRVLNAGLKKPRKITYGPEASVQKALLEYIFMQYPQVFAHVVKIHNEGNRSGIGTFVLKKLGLHPGASDLFVSWPTSKHPGLWLEIKRDGYKPTITDKKHLERQQRFLEQQRAVGYMAEFGIGIDACILIIDDYLHERKTFTSVSLV